MRLIDADELEPQMKYAHLFYENGTENLGMTRVLLGSAVKNAPTIEAEPVRHGHWVAEPDGGTRCSVCKQTVKEDSNGVAVPVDLSAMPYCPKCGAKMGAADIHVPAREDGEVEEK